uniref:Uncharacterized protein n=1 Tax=Trichobilharzia regenti TaxID=157069 RepID=A0AA85JAX0_TRIRE|nr:unnamed protein product [Trichobilharzia regenti]
MNSGSATQESNVNCRGKSKTSELDEECDELIIIHEENTSNVAAQPPSDNVQAESTTNCDEDSFVHISVKFNCSYSQIPSII